jgi:hypothetical protein
MAQTKELVTVGIGKELLLREAGKKPMHRLEFDSSSGELRLAARSGVTSAPNSNVAFVDQIASDGFA